MHSQVQFMQDSFFAAKTWIQCFWERLIGTVHHLEGILAKSSLQNILNSWRLHGFFAWTVCFTAFIIISNREIDTTMSHRGDEKGFYSVRQHLVMIKHSHQGQKVLLWFQQACTALLFNVSLMVDSFVFYLLIYFCLFHSFNEFPFN